MNEPRPLKIDNWSGIDTLILGQTMLYAIKMFRKQSGSSLAQAIEACFQRKHLLMSQSPERFPSEEDRRAEAVIINGPLAETPRSLE